MTPVETRSSRLMFSGKPLLNAPRDQAHLRQVLQNEPLPLVFRDDSPPLAYEYI